MQDRDQFDADQAPKKDDQSVDRSSGDCSLDEQSRDDQSRSDPASNQTASDVQDTSDQTERDREEQVLLTDGQTCETPTHKRSASSLAAQNGQHPQNESNNHHLKSKNLTENPVDSSGEKLSIDDLIEQFSKLLFGYGYRLSGSVSDAEDLTQQTFMIAHQKLSQLRSESAAKSWLCAILRSCWLKSIRKNQPRPVSSLEIELSDFLVDSNHDIEFDSVAIQNALLDLPPDYRLVLLMYYFEDLSYQEIAEKLKVKMGTVMSRLSRAKDRIRQRLKNKDSLLDK